MDPAPPYRPRHWTEHPLFHLLLFGLTFVTLTFAGGAFAEGGGALGKGRWADGLSFSIPVLVILGVHEMGHYVMCRRNGLAATLPYFIPSPLVIPPLWTFGTFGAVIRIKEPIRDKRVLLDVGAAGPLAGFVACLPFLFYGVARARPSLSPLAPDTPVFAYPLLVGLAQDWTGVGRYTALDMHAHPTFMAAWFGMLVTCFNLLPVGQLDGGHVLRAALGKRQPIVSGAVVALAFASVLWVPSIWAFFVLLVAAFVGVEHPPPENDADVLGTGRLTIALVCLAVFLLCFTPAPIRQFEELAAGRAAAAPAGTSRARR